MKRIILLLINCLILSNVNANSDSLNCISDSNYFNEIIDSNSVQEVNVVSFESNKPNKIVKKLENKKEKKLKNLAKPANWFEDAWDAFIDLFKPVWGHYEEDGQRSEGPYFLFDRNFDGPTYTQIQMQRTYKI
jgi:hypothetical protein